MAYLLTVGTAEGNFEAYYSEVGLLELRFPGSCSGPETSWKCLPGAISAWHGQTTAAVAHILSGKAPESLPTLDLRLHSEFRRAVWDQLGRIGVGETLSYGEVGERLGKPGAARAVGNACGANPIPLIIPCHRVLGAGNVLGGFSGGLEWKRKLLALEGVRVKEPSAGRLEAKAKKQLEFAVSSQAF